MFDRINQIAEQAATNVSRRQFLGRLGRGALGVATAVAGLLAISSAGQGASPWGRTCGFESVFECQGRATGDACENGAGRCRRIRGTANSCYCWVKGNG